MLPFSHGLSGCKMLCSYVYKDSCVHVFINSCMLVFVCSFVHAFFQSLSFSDFFPNRPTAAFSVVSNIMNQATSAVDAAKYSLQCESSEEKDFCNEHTYESMTKP